MPLQAFALVLNTSDETIVGLREALRSDLGDRFVLVEVALGRVSTRCVPVSPTA